MPTLNPLTWLVTALSLMVLIIGVNQPWLSATVLAVSLAVGVCGARSLAPALTTAALVVPTGASMALVHAPHGAHTLWGPVTADGLLVAGELTLRFAALIAVLLAAVANIRIDELVKALQVSRAGHRLAYILGAALQLLPQGTRTVQTVRDAHQLAGRRIGVTGAIPRLAVPVMTQLLTLGARRGAALEAAGFDLPGRRTVLAPVPDTRAEQIARVLIPLLVVAAVVIAWLS